jgi:hypothetical protein
MVILMAFVISLILLSVVIIYSIKSKDKEEMFIRNRILLLSYIRKQGGEAKKIQIIMDLEMTPQILKEVSNRCIEEGFLTETDEVITVTHFGDAYYNVHMYNSSKGNDSG